MIKTYFVDIKNPVSKVTKEQDKQVNHELEIYAHTVIQNSPYSKIHTCN